VFVVRCVRRFAPRERLTSSSCWPARQCDVLLLHFCRVDALYDEPRRGDIPVVVVPHVIFMHGAALFTSLSAMVDSNSSASFFSLRVNSRNSAMSECRIRVAKASVLA